MCESVVLYLLHVIGEKYVKEVVGLLRDDGLACFDRISGTQADWIRKDFIIIFKDKFRISIVCDANLEIVNFLDMTLYLPNGKYHPYNKPL